MSSIAPPVPPVIPPSDGDASIASSLVAISKSMRIILGLRLAELNLLPGQDDLLLALEPRVTLPVTLLGASINVRASTISKMADKLVILGLIERVSAERDARQSFLRLTAKGYRMRERIQTIRSELTTEIETEAKASGLELAPADLEALATILRQRVHRLR